MMEFVISKGWSPSVASNIKRAYCFLEAPEDFSPFHLSVAFHIETNHLICCANRMTGFCVKYSPELQWVNTAT